MPELAGSKVHSIQVGNVLQIVPTELQASASSQSKVSTDVTSLLRLFGFGISLTQFSVFVSRADPVVADASGPFESVAAALAAHQSGLTESGGERYRLLHVAVRSPTLVRYRARRLGSQAQRSDSATQQRNADQGEETRPQRSAAKDQRSASAAAATIHGYVNFVLRNAASVLVDRSGLCVCLVNATELVTVVTAPASAYGSKLVHLPLPPGKIARSL